MDGGAKCTVTKNLKFLRDVRFYDKNFQPKVKMQGATSKATIVPVAEAFLKVPTISDGVFMKIKCYYSPEFTSTLLSDNDILELLPMKKSYCRRDMVKFFEPHEIKELPTREQDKIKNQKYP